MNEKEIERKLAEILSSRGNILPGFSSNGGQLGDQLIVSLDGIRDAVQGIALTSIPPGKIGAVFDKVLQQWYILSNEQPIVIRQDKSERQNKEKPKQPDSTITLLKTKEFPKILVLHKNPKFNTKLYEYYKKEFKYRMVLEPLNFEILEKPLLIKYYFLPYLDEQSYGGSQYLEEKFEYFKDLENTNVIKEKYKKCNGQVDVGKGTSGTGTQDDPFLTEDIRKMDAVIKAHPGYKFYVEWASKHHEESYNMSILYGQYSATIKNVYSAESSGELNIIPPLPGSIYVTGGKYTPTTNTIKTPNLSPYGYGQFVHCGDVENCESLTEGNFGENIHFNTGYAYVISSKVVLSSVTSNLNLQTSFNGSVGSRICILLYTDSYACWVDVNGTSDYGYNYKISGFQALPPEDPELFNDKWPDDGYIGGEDGSPGDEIWKETCDYPEALENIFNIYKLYFYFNKKQYHLDIKCRSRTDQEHKVYYSTYTHTKSINDTTQTFHYDIITQKLINFIPKQIPQKPTPTNNYKYIYIDLLYFDETNQEIHNLTLFNFYYEFGIPINIQNNSNNTWGINSFIPWEYKIYKKDGDSANKFIYKEDEIVYYNLNLHVVYTENKYQVMLFDKILPTIFEDWEQIIENDWRRNISQTFPVISNTGDNDCIKNIRDNNFYTVNLSESDSPKKGTIHFINPQQPIKEYQNQTLSELIFNTNKKININRTDSDYIIEKVDNVDTCTIEETGFKTMNIDGITNIEEGEYSLESIMYSKNNKPQKTDV